ncbi:MAG TPA: phosphatidylserine decarboxylase family protein [Nitrospirota bacterium]|nr:phosphatidylserine decarboxylase family protein [Nitrospirota bacterium]
MMKNYGIPVAAEGWPFIVPLALATVLLFALGWRNAGAVLLVLTLFVLFFFRDPERAVPQGEGVVVSPADGKVIVIKDIYEPDYLKQDVKQISIFLSVFNVHVNRAPIGGAVEAVRYNPGKFHVASVDKASHLNEQTAMVIATGKNKVLVKQIAGLIARRIVCYAKPGDTVKAGERYGLIRFGSRVDLFLPKDAELKVKLGDRIKGARDIIAVLR